MSGKSEMSGGKSTTGGRPEDWLSQLRKMQQDSLDPLRWFGVAWFEGVTAINRELAEFVSRRISEDLRTQHEILNCGDPEKLQHIQARFIQRAIDDYTAETGTLVELSEGVAQKLAGRGTRHR